MTDRIEALEGQVGALQQEVEALRRRLDAVEALAPASAPVAGAPTTPAARRRRAAAAAAAASTAGGAPSAPGAAAEPGLDVARDVAAAAAVAPLAGRTLLLLAGAFVLRALTDAGTLPAAAGVALGFAYAGVVLALCARSAQPAAAGFHGVAAVLVGFPLLLEATSRFGLLGPGLSAALLAALSAAVLLVAVRRGLPWVAWTGTAASLATGVALMVVTGRLVPATLALVAVGALTLWLARAEAWRGLRWPVALVADLAVVAVAARALAPGAAEGPAAAQLAAGVLLVVYLGGATAVAMGRSLGLGQALGAFEGAQTLGALAAGLGGAAFVAVRSGDGGVALGAACLAAAAGAYAVAFAGAARQPPGSPVARLAAGVALALAAAGAWLALAEPARSLGLGVLALAAAALGRSPARRALLGHAAAAAFLAAAASGLLVEAERALFSSAAAPWPTRPLSALGVLACLVLAAVLAGGAAARVTWRERAPHLALHAVALLAAAGAAAGGLAQALGPPGPDADLGVVGTARTAVLAGGAVVAAWLGRREALREAGWLAWPTLGALGLKLLLEDFPRGRPATLILSLAFTGAALILVPRLRARGRDAAGGAAAALQ